MFYPVSAGAPVKTLRGGRAVNSLETAAGSPIVSFIFRGYRLHSPPSAFLSLTATVELALLTLAALLTSMLSAIAGLGGGVLLMLLMPGLVPLGAIVPLHAVVQSVSNAARVAFAMPSVAVRLIPPLLLGSLAGALVGSLSVGLVSLEWLPAVAGAVILIITWLPVTAIIPKGRAAFYFLGFYQTGLGMLAGATGPLGASVLTLISKDRDWLVVNTGVYMTINHVIRSFAYGLLGFAFAPWWETIAVMSFGMVAGAWLGTKVRQRVPQGFFEQAFKWLITVLAVRMVSVTLSEVAA